MPEMEGLETIRQIGRQCADLPVIVMTGFLNDLYRDLGLKLGARHALSTPFSTQELLDAVQTALSGEVPSS
jgi:DNA-binding NarL/FixJ family response regulator